MNDSENRSKIPNAIKRRLPSRYQFQATRLPFKLNREETIQPEDKVPVTRVRSSYTPKPRSSSSPALPAPPTLSDAPARKSVTSSFKLPYELNIRLTSLIRVRLSLVVISLIAAILLFRLYTLQVTESGSLTKRAADLHMQKSEIPARRGLIRDSNGLVLAFSRISAN